MQSTLQALPQFSQPLSFRNALTSSITPPEQQDATQVIYSSGYADGCVLNGSVCSSSSFLVDDGMNVSQDFSSETVDNLTVDPDALHAFGIIEYRDQVQLTRFLQLGYELGYDGNLCKSIGTVVRYMKSFMTSSKRIKDANEALEAEKLDLLQQLQQKETEVVAMGMLKDREYGQRLELLEAELRQKGLDMENAGSKHCTEIERMSLDCESAREEMDRVQQACTQKDAIIEGLRKRVSELEGECDAMKPLKDQVASLKMQNMALSEAQSLTQSMVDSVNHMREFGMFHDRTLHEEMACPVLCCSGAMASMKSVVTSWAESGGNSDGTIERTFRCSETGKMTTIVPQPQFEVVQKLASAICINMEPPCTFEYGSEGHVTTCSVYDILAIASRVCKIFREKSVDDEEMMMLKGGLVVMFYLTDVEGTSRKRLGFSVHKMQKGSASTVHAGRFRVTDRNWNPFSETMEFAVD
jgi:hypothetical protein